MSAQPEMENALPEEPIADAAEVETSETPSIEQENLLLKDQLLRAMAETENVRKRAQREVEDASKYAMTSFAREMVNVMENLHRAIQSIPAELRTQDNVKAIVEGVDLTMRELEQIFTRFHITRLFPQGEKFDHNHHQAVAQIESADVAEGHIAQVLQAGYTLQDRLLRPAMVAVSKGQGSAAPATHVDTQA